MSEIRRDDPMRKTMEAAHRAVRCGARTRVGTSCCQPAMRNGRCRMHGGLSTGPRTLEGLERMRTAKTVHGAYGAAAEDLRNLVRVLKGLTKRVPEVV